MLCRAGRFSRQMAASRSDSQLTDHHRARIWWHAPPGGLAAMMKNRPRRSACAARYETLRPGQRGRRCGQMQEKEICGVKFHVLILRSINLADHCA